MPIYDYHCQACGKEEERLVNVDARNLQSCHGCGARLTKKLSRFQFKFMGNFHHTSNIASDGEGFKSVSYNSQEAAYRNRYNLHREDKL
uniref:Putative regulatory protein FmdB zinc ribbon domain-containing protein n=1 Tax=viral metagenome TaxID=1070528 RepID=A0A6M3KJX5_9ZZZZ